MICSTPCSVFLICQFALIQFTRFLEKCKNEIICLSEVIRILFSFKFFPFTRFYVFCSSFSWRFLIFFLFTSTIPFLFPILRLLPSYANPHPPVGLVLMDVTTNPRLPSQNFTSPPPPSLLQFRGPWRDERKLGDERNVKRESTHSQIFMKSTDLRSLWSQRSPKLEAKQKWSSQLMSTPSTFEFRLYFNTHQTPLERNNKKPV